VRKKPNIPAKQRPYNLLILMVFYKIKGNTEIKEGNKNVSSGDI